MQTIFPILRYNDAREAIRWLCSAFGFVQLFSVPASGNFVRHAQLKLGRNLIMVGSVRPDDGIVSPAALGSASRCWRFTWKIRTRTIKRLDRRERRLCIRPRILTSVHVSITLRISRD